MRDLPNKIYLMKKYLKILFLVIAFWQALANPVSVSLALAQEASPTPTDTPAETQTLTDESPSPSDTPTETPTPTPDETIVTGDSLSTSDSQTAGNLSDFSPTPEPTQTATPEATLEFVETEIATPSATPQPADLIVSQDGVASSQTSSVSTTGDNSQTSSDSATAVTGDSVAASNSVTTVNINSVNSNVITAIQNILTADSPDVNLYQALIDAINSNPNAIPAGTITVNQNGAVCNETTAISSTGGNVQEASGSATLSTGNSAAVSNSITIANLNLVGSNAIFAIINIFGEYGGNIILPNGFNIPQTASPYVSLNVEQNASVSSETTAISSTGNNSQISSNAQMLTGSSQAGSNSVTAANISSINQYWGYLIINNAGNWTGALLNWASPGSVQTLSQGSFNLPGIWNQSSTAGSGQTDINVEQNAIVSSNTSSVSSTGGNSQVSGISDLVTGNSNSYANSFTLANINSIGGGLFFGIVNILGDFSGNIVSAYPKLEVTVTDNQDKVLPGGTENYSITVKNAGFGIAHGVGLNFNWPDFIDHSDQISAWSLGDLMPGASQTFSVSGHIFGSVQPGTELLASATAETPDTQESVTGNTGSDSTVIDNWPDPTPDSRTPELYISVWNNVKNYILPGDSIWVEITLENKSNFTAHDVTIHGTITDDHPVPNTPMDITIGDIPAGEHVKITFNANLPKDSIGAVYYITTKATGHAANGDATDSNTATSEFLVKAFGKVIGQLVTDVSAEELNNEAGSNQEVLGSSTNFLTDLLSNWKVVIPVLLIGYTVVIVGKKKLTNSK